MKKCYAYLRVSGVSQVKGHGLERQERAIKRYAKVHGLEVATFYHEKGVSGTLEDRPALAQLMIDLEHNGHGIKTVVIEKLDRLARDIMVQEAIVRDLQRQGFELISVAEGEGLAGDDPTREFIRIIFGGIAQYDKKMLVLKLKAARDRKRSKTGRCEGRPLYGHTAGEKHLLHRMRALRRKQPSGYQRTYAQVADILNTEGHLTRYGKEWSAAGVYQILNRK